VELDYRRLASDFLRALRAKRSQLAFSRRLGFRTNVAYAWESGRRFPTAASVFAAEFRLNPGARLAFPRFFANPPAWLKKTSASSARGVALLLDEVRGSLPMVEAARRAGVSRYAVARWLRAEAEPRFPDFLRLFEVTSLRLLDFIALFHDPAELPSAAKAWQALNARRHATYELPWIAAVVLALELRQYSELPRHVPGWIAELLGISVEEEARCLAALKTSGQIRMSRGRWIVDRSMTVDTRSGPDAERALKRWWAEVGLERLSARAPGQFSFNVFAVSSADLERLRELHSAYFRQLRAIVAASEPSEHIAVVNLQLFELGARSV
jgi:transcriptional regulator with XRE-family HTH domain